jgi:sigma-E factor negative regulatory protein RseA
VLRRVRERLAQEPVVLAPEFLQRSERAAEPRRGWRAAGAVAAGFVAVAGVYSFMRPAGDPTGLLARVPVASSSVVARADTPSPFIAASQVAIASPSSGDQGLRLVRDARLDAYLAAHKQFAGSSSIGMPSVYVRSSSLETGTSDGR